MPPKPATAIWWIAVIGAIARPDAAGGAARAAAGGREEFYAALDLGGSAPPPSGAEVSARRPLAPVRFGFRLHAARRRSSGS